MEKQGDIQPGQCALPVGPRDSEDGGSQKGEDHRPERGERNVVARGHSAAAASGVREGEGELAPAGVPLAVADVLQHPEPVRAHAGGEEKAAVYLSRNKDSDSEWSEGNVASTSFLPGCVLVMPDEGDLLEFHRQAEIVAGHFPAPAASIPAAHLAASPVPPFVTKLDSETVQCCSLLMPYCNRTDDENCVQNRQSC